MRLAVLCKKTILENLRDWKIIILTVTFAPFFVLLMYFYFGDTVKPLRVCVLNRDQGCAAPNNKFFYAGKELISAMKNARYPEGKNILDVALKTSISDARESLKNKEADLVVEIPGDFSITLMQFRQKQASPAAMVRSIGDHTNLKYIMAAAFSDAIIYRYAAEITGWKGPLDFQYETIGFKKSLSEFDLYVPGLLALSLMMLMFTAAASMIKEKDKGTIIRLRLSKMTTGEFFTSISLVQVIIGMLSLGLTYLTAVALGYRSSGSLIAVMVVGVLASLSIIAISLVVAGLLRTIFDLMTIGCFPFFILMFFSGGMFPIPSLGILSIGSRIINVNDILPTTHAITALNKIMNYAADLENIAFEIGALVVTSLFYFFIGLVIFRKRHLQAV